MKGEKRLSFGFWKGLLSVTTALAVGYVIYGFVFASRDYGSSGPAAPDALIGSGAQGVKAGQQKDYNAFLRDVERKKIFAVPVVTKKTQAQPDRKKLQKVIDNLRLVGIIAGTPSRAIVEDKKQAQTFNLIEGESFLDEIKVETVGKDSVVIIYQEEQFELYL